MKRFASLLTIMLMLLTIGASAVEISEVRESSWLERALGSPFSIATNKKTYVQGETAVIEDFQDLNAACEMLSVQVQIVDSSNKIYSSNSLNIGKAGYMTAYVKFKEDTTVMNPDTYKISSNWNCDGTLLGQDGYKDKFTDGSVSTFSVVKKTIVTTVIPPAQACSRTCAVGYKLYNEDKADCYCKATYKLGDGTCSIGEPAASDDCVELVVVQPSEGTSATTEKPAGDMWIVYAGIVVLVIAGVILVIKKLRD